MILSKYPPLSPHIQFTNLKIIRISHFTQNLNLPASKQSDVSSILAGSPQSRKGSKSSGRKRRKPKLRHTGTQQSSAPTMCVLESKAVCAPQKPANLVTLPLVVVVPVSACVPCCTERRYSVPGSPEVVTERYELQPE